MKQIIILLCCMVSTIAALAQDKMFIHKTDHITLGAPVASTDSVYFNNKGANVSFKVGASIVTYPVTTLDSISFGDNSNTITVTYNSTSASVINPLAFEGVSVAVNGADVIVTSTSETKNINYSLSGTTTNGTFKIYSDYTFNLILNGVNITNDDGPAINIQSSKKASVVLADGTTNSTTDGTTYATSTEDQKSAFFSEGQLVFEGNGSLTVKSLSKHAICSDDYIRIENGSIVITGATKDGVHAKDYFAMTGGSLNITATGDGIESEGYIDISGGTLTETLTSADVKGLVSDSIMTISGGTITITTSGNQSKGLKADQNMSLNGGNITINTSGGVVLTASGSGYDASYCTAIKCDSSVTVNGATITINSAGISGKGISADKNVNIVSGTVNITASGAGAKYTNITGTADSYSSSCISTDSNLSIIGGMVTAKSSGLGGKGLSSEGTITFGDANNSPVISITTTGAKFVVSGTDYCHPKAIRATGAIVINNGATTISSSDDGMHSDASITQNGGSIVISTSVEAVESKYITINGGSINLAASNDGFNCTFSTVSGGTESNDGSCLTINGGNVVATCTNGDAIDSNGNIVITGGTTIANGPVSGAEEAADFNGTFNMNGGFFIGAGSNSNMTKAMSSTSKQYNLFISSGSVISSGTLFHIQDDSGIDIVTFKPLNGGYKFLFSSSALTTGKTYYVYTGGSSTGTSTNGLYSGGAYSGGTQKKSFTISGSVTSLSF